jgi:hypothetical protein
LSMLGQEHGIQGIVRDGTGLSDRGIANREAKFGLFKVLLETGKFFVTGCLCHLGQCLDQLLLCAE